MSVNIYTYENWKRFKKEHDLNNADVSEIIGTTENNVQVQCRSNKKLPTWARALVYMWLTKKDK